MLDVAGLGRGVFDVVPLRAPYRIAGDALEIRPGRLEGGVTHREDGDLHLYQTDSLRDVARQRKGEQDTT